ncbi:MAG: FAD-dependent oxidoreductase [Phycisphaerae bacterium]|jgi:hypothetical protein|nr:FAD-dependent oxidoreductase [Phycisphaerae bacterium]MDP7636853.1 FAD-dependent oxidoreductase [Phycisphaerae bacterium]
MAGDTGVYRLGSRDIPVLGDFDVVVCGGGPAGVPAAMAGRRQGLSVLLVEGLGQLGGMGTAGMVSLWLGGRTGDCNRWVVGGIFRQMATEAAQRGFALLPQAQANRKYHPFGWKDHLLHGIPFDPFAMAAYLDEKVTEAGVEVLLMTQAFDAAVEGRRITHVILCNKNGLSAVKAKAFIDATGDADIAARSGCDVIAGREEDGLMMPATLMFIVDRVDQDALSAYIHQHEAVRFADEISRLRSAGKWPFPYDIFISIQLTEKGTMLINTSRLCGVDGTDAASVTEGLIRGRAEVRQLLVIMREHFPGFANARLKAVAPALGIRETRRICSHFTMTVDDVLNGRQFPDTIGFSSYEWDVPDAKRPSYQAMHKQDVPKPTVTPIPYRIMIPRPIENLICPGRPVSVEHQVLGPLRVMGPCFAMGEAAGQAARQVVRHGVAFGEVNVQELRDELKANGAIVDWDQ